MQNKGAITLLAVALALVSLYQLFFTYKTNQVENAAKEFANGNPIKEKEYLDSVANQPVYNFLGLAKFTYKECKELELNLGLDLKGGMNVTMEVDVVDVVKSLANHSTDPAFNQAIEEAVKMRVSSPKDFVTLFGEAFEKIAPGAQLASPAIFGTHELKEKIKVGASNKEVLDVIRKEADGAIDNTLLWVVAMAVAGCLFVIPTAAEIPIVQTMMLAGMGTAPALALLITLPAISLPSLVMLRKSFPAKALWLTAGLVALSGVMVGSIALV